MSDSQYKSFDVRAHVRRVQLCVSLNDVAGLPGALADLYIALGQTGYDTKHQMLKESYHLLTEDMVDLFYSWLHNEFNYCDPVLSQIRGSQLLQWFVSSFHADESHNQDVEL